MAAPAIIQKPTYDGALQGNPYSFLVPGVTPLSTVVFFAMATTSNRQYAVETDRDDEVITYVRNAWSNRILVTGYFHDAVGGDTNLIFTSDGTQGDTWKVIAYEIEDCFIYLHGSQVEPTQATQSYAAKAAGLDVLADSLILFCGGHRSDASPIVPGTGYTADFVASGDQFAAFSKSTATALPNERPTWTHGNRETAGITYVAVIPTGGGGDINGVARQMNSLDPVTQNSTEAFTINMTTDDGRTPAPGLTLTSELKKAGGAYVTVSPGIVDNGGGGYTITPIDAHRDTLGKNAWRFTATGATQWDGQERVQNVTDEDIEKIPRAATALTEGATYKLNKATETATELEQSITQN